MGSAGGSHSGSFSGPTKRLSLKGFLFDFDGTIVDSTPAIVKHWQDLAKELGVDPDKILANSHGRRSIDTLALYDKSKANWEYVARIEGELPEKYGSDAKELPGARGTLDALSAKGAPWAIVTSGTRPLATGWMKVLSLPMPPVLVVAEDVEEGKPDPACYRLGLERVGLKLADSNQVLVIEDAPAGVKAGKAAGCTVLGLGTTHAVEKLREAGADYIIEDLASLQVLEAKDGMTTIELRNIWKE